MNESGGGGQEGILICSRYESSIDLRGSRDREKIMMGFVMDDRKVEEKWKFVPEPAFCYLCLFTVLFGALPLVLFCLSFVQEINPSFDVFNIFIVII